MRRKAVLPIVSALLIALYCCPVLALDDDVPIDVTLSMATVPVVGQTGTVTATVSVDRVLPDVVVEIQVPGGGTVTENASSVVSLMRPGEPVSVSAKVKFDSTGNKLIRAVARSQEREGVIWSDVCYLGVNIGSTKSTLGFDLSVPEARSELLSPGDGVIIGQPNFKIKPSKPAPPPPAISNGGPDAPRKLLDGTPVTAGTLVVTGYWKFYDRNGVHTGQRDALMELLRGDNNDHLAWAYTNWSGEFTFPAVTNPGSAGVYVKCRTWTNYGSGNEISTITPGGDAWNDCHWATTSIYVFADGTYSVGTWTIPSSTTLQKAWWIQDDMVKATWVPPNFTGKHCAEWSSTSSDGAYYVPGGHIHLAAGDADDTPDRVLHEMGHSVMYNIYGNYMPPYPNCNPHYIDKVSSQGCAWIEGWAHAHALWCTNDPVRNWPGGGAVNLETPTWGTSGWDNGDSVEGRISGVLWDIADSTNDGYDDYSGSWNDIWDVLYNVNDDVLFDFWTSWKSRGHAKHGPVKCLYQNTIDYNTWPTFSGLPDISTNEDTPINNAIDLWVYAYDPESYDSELTYTIVGNTNPSCGVSIDSLDYVDVNPSPNWYGTSTVTIRCSDGIRYVDDSFIVTVKSVNDPPVLSQLPNRYLSPGTSWYHAIDLYSYAYDVETPDSSLIYQITAVSDPQCGVSIDASRYINIYPTAGWAGVSSVTVRITDSAGAWDESTFYIVAAYYCSTCAGAREYPDGTWVRLPNKTVTAVFPSQNAFYVEDDASRASGIRVSYSGAVEENDIVQVAGPLSTYYAERVITASWFYKYGVDSTPPKPLGMNNRSLGGAAPNAYTRAVPEGRAAGPYNVGLLTRTMGTVTMHSGSSYFWIDDGSHVIYDGTNNALLVRWTPISTPMPPIGARVAVTGISGATTLSGKAINMFRPRRASDVKGLGGTLAYILNTDVTTSNAFYNMFYAYNWRQRTYYLSDVPSADFSNVDLIVIGHDTGLWTDAAKVNKILNSGKPVIAVGSGGAQFLDKVTSPDIYIGWGNSAVTSSATTGYVDNPGLVTYFFDNLITIPSDNLLPMFTSASVCCILYNPPTSVTKVLRDAVNTTYWAVAQENRFLQWGYDASPTTMTTDAKRLFINCLYYMQGK
jgi:hypothetical protein